MAVTAVKPRKKEAGSKGKGKGKDAASDQAKEDPVSAAKNQTLASRHAADLAEAGKFVDAAQIGKAAEALLKHVQLHRAKVKEARKKLDLFDGEETDEVVDASTSAKNFVMTTFALKKIPVKHPLSYKSKRIPVRHPMVTLSQIQNQAAAGAAAAGEEDEGAEDPCDICLFVKDKKEAAKWIAEDGGVKIRKVISLAELRTSYHQFKAKRELLAMYDVFLGDDRIVCMLPKALGGIFYKSSKRPVPLRLAQRQGSAGKLSSRVRLAVESAYFAYQGSQSVMRSAKVSFSPEQVAENVLDSIAGAAPKLPGGWANVQAIHIKTGNSAALPVYMSRPSVKPTLQDSDADEPEADDEMADAATKKTKAKAVIKGKAVVKGGKAGKKTTEKKTKDADIVSSKSKSKKRSKPAKEEQLEDEDEEDDEEENDDDEEVEEPEEKVKVAVATPAKKKKRKAAPAATTGKKQRTTRSEAAKPAPKTARKGK